MVKLLGVKFDDRGILEQINAHLDAIALEEVRNTDPAAIEQMGVENFKNRVRESQLRSLLCAAILQLEVQSRLNGAISSNCSKED